MPTGRTLQVLSGHGAGVNGIAFSAYGTHLASGSWDRTVRLWDLENRTSRVVGEHEGRVYWLDIDPGGERIGAPSPLSSFERHPTSSPRIGLRVTGEAE
jgi:WD40 repeat protein